MLKRVKELTRGLESYAFWEERMGCGTGICYGCAVKRANGKGYLRFCQEGPVLRMSDIEI
jgi:dihydroorotate dehydrogenase electron transfer subunit